MSTRIPPLLEPYLQLPPESSLIVLTQVLGASTNWLVQRYLCSLLGTASRRQGVKDSDSARQTAEAADADVVLVSFMRDYAFWRDGAGRLGLDLETLSKAGRFRFVDGLSRLFSDGPTSGPQASTTNDMGKWTLQGATLKDLQRIVGDALGEHSERTVVLILDSPDLFLAASGDVVSAEDLRGTVLDFREKVAATIVTLAADEPLIAQQSTTLEKEHAALTLSLAHEAEMVVGLRLLDTGTAKDVSGVLRITHGGAATGFVPEERELLYYVGSDGGVRVFERGQ